MKYSWSSAGAKMLVALSFLVMAVSIMSATPNSLIKVMSYYGVSSQSALNISAIMFVVTLVLTSLFGIASLFKPALSVVFVLLTLAVSALPLISLFGSLHWIDSLGGFPAIGSGQGIIKYFALVAIAFACTPYARHFRFVAVMNYLPVALVLLWIGGMKFTEIEAKGIEDLVNTSPLMSWLYTGFSVQETSNLIGVYDLTATVILGLGLYFRVLFLPGWFMALAVFITTQTFIFSFPGAVAENGIFTSTGLFLIKDLWFVANMLLLLEYHVKSQARLSRGEFY